MSRENVRVFCEGVDAMRRGDVEGRLAGVADDVVWLPARSAVEGAYQGHDGLRKFLADNATIFEVFEPDFRELRDLVERALAVGTIRIRGRGSGVETNIPTAGVATFERGKLSRWEDFRERHLALEALGLRD